jgi:hypothetical protein
VETVNLHKKRNLELNMGRSMYNFGKQTKEKARQQKQLAKASKRIAAKQQKANPETDATGEEPREIVVAPPE